MNPYAKEAWFVHYLDEKDYVNDVWHDTGLWVEVRGLGLVICTISISTGWSCNAGFRIVDENDRPLPPYRTKNNNRHPTHFSSEPVPTTPEDITPVTFHMIANCQYAKLQIRPSDGSGVGKDGRIRINASNTVPPPTDAAWSHKPISTMTAIPLVPFYQPGANTIFTYPQSRMPRTSRMPDKPPVIHRDKSSNLLKKDSA